MDLSWVVSINLYHIIHLLVFFFLYCSMCIASLSSIKEINRLRRFPEVMHAMPKNCKKDSSHEKKMV